MLYASNFSINLFADDTCLSLSHNDIKNHTSVLRVIRDSARGELYITIFVVMQYPNHINVMH